MTWKRPRDGLCGAVVPIVPRFWRTKDVHLSASIPALCWLNRYELVVVMRDIYAATWRCEWGANGALGHLGTWRWDLESIIFPSKSLSLRIFTQVLCLELLTVACGDVGGHIHSSQFNLLDSQVGVVNIESGALVRRQDIGLSFDTLRPYLRP